VDEFKYEGSALGNWEFSGVYLPGEEKDHHLDAEKYQGQAQWEKDGSRLVAEVMLNKTQTEFEKASAA
jgi:hypothetical protein